MRIEMRDPSDLSLHPIAKRVPELGKESIEFAALVEDIRRSGILQPLVIDRSGRVMDGRARWLAAKRLQLLEVPVVVREEGEVYGIIVGSLAARRHYTKSGIAYLSYPFLEPAFEASGAARLMEKI